MWCVLQAVVGWGWSGSPRRRTRRVSLSPLLSVASPLLLLSGDYDDGDDGGDGDSFVV